MTCRRPHPNETRARSRKAALIADVLALHGATSADAAALPDTGRANSAALAGVGNPSEATWAAVVGILQSREQRPAPADPNVEALVG